MSHETRRLHSLEKTVAIIALVAAVVLAAGFAQAAGPNRHRHHVHRTSEQGIDGATKVFLRSAAAFVQDVETGEVVLGKNSDTVLPIASISKLMTAMVLLDAHLDPEEEITLTRQDVDHKKGTRSRLRPGMIMTRGDLLLIALMASENRAAAALGRTYPGGIDAFVAAMNAKAQALGMHETHFVEPTGLSSQNVSNAKDLAVLVNAAHGYPAIRDYTTRERAEVYASGRRMVFRNTNRLVRNPNWDIELSKTGYISEAGRCLVMRIRLASKDLVVVLLDSWGKYSRFADARRIRRWAETSWLADSAN